MALEMLQARKGAMAVFARQRLAVRRGSLLAHLAWRVLTNLHGANGISGDVLEAPESVPRKGVTRQRLRSVKHLGGLSGEGDGLWGFW